jgi:uncharacterized protein YbjQ (UPF0145 family)
MLLTTQDRFEDREITQTLGLVRGNTIRARHLGKDILAAFRNVVGGEVIEYTKMMAEAREQALDRMAAKAQEAGADGIVGIRFTSATVMSGAAEIVVYGTAVKLK